MSQDKNIYLLNWLWVIPLFPKLNLSKNTFLFKLVLVELHKENYKVILKHKMWHNSEYKTSQWFLVALRGNSKTFTKYLVCSALFQLLCIGGTHATSSAFPLPKGGSLTLSSILTSIQYPFLFQLNVCYVIHSTHHRCNNSFFLKWCFLFIFC